MSVALTPGELKMAARARENALRTAALLEEPISNAEDIHQALRAARASGAALEYLSDRARGVPPPKRDQP